MEPGNPIVEYLWKLRRTVRRRLFAYGAFAILAGGVAALLTIVALDWLLWLPAVLRLIGGALFLIGFVGAAVHWVVRPLGARISVDELAAQLERRFRASLPAQDQLSSTVYFLRAENKASPAMVQRVIADTERMIRELPLDSALSVRPLAMRAAVFAVGLLVLAGIMLLAPQWTRTGLARYADPWGAVEWPRSVEIHPLTKDQLVALGESAVVRMEIVRGMHHDLRGVVTLREPDGHTQVLTMQREPDGTFSTTVDGVTEDLVYWFEAGDDSTERRPSLLRVVRRPEVVEALATIDPPPYAGGHGSRTVDLGDAPVTATVGGHVTIQLRSSKPIAAHEGIGLRTETGDLLPLILDPADPRNASVRIPVASDLTLRPELRDEQGFSNRGGSAYVLRAVPDASPLVSVLEPASMAESTPTGSLRVAVRAEDDFGIAALHLHVFGLRDGRTLDVALNDRMSVARTEDHVEAAASYLWDFSALDVAPGDVLVGEIVAVDNRDLDPPAAAPGGAETATPAGADQDGQTARSAPFRVKIISQSEFETRVREELAVLEGRLRQAILDQAGLRDRIIALLRTDDAAALDEADRESVARVAAAQSRLSQQLRDLAARLHELVARMQRNHAGDDQDRERLSNAGDQLRRVASGATAEAAAKLARVYEQTAAAQQEAMNAGAELQEESVERLSAVLRAMSRWGAFAGLLSRTRDLLDRQNAVRGQTSELGGAMLGKPVETLSPEEAAALKRLERQQEQIADDVDRHLATLEQLAESTREKDPSGAEAIESALRVGRANDLGKRVRSAAEAIRGNRTAGAGLDQKAAAEAIRKMVAALRERDERELAELRRNLERAEELVAALLEEQRALRTATHETEQVGAEQTTLLGLADGQRLLARNTRMLAEELMEVPRAMMPGRRVGQAVEPMNRAEGELRGGSANGGSAAVPAQDEAIVHLSDALAQLEALARESAEEAFRRTITHIHEELSAIADAERSVHESIDKLHAAVREGGRMGRLETREAAKLAREQAEILQMTNDIVPDLEKVPVYEWAIRRIVQWMAAGRTQLEERRIDEELLTTTQRIVRELDKLIAALVETQKMPSTTEFAEAEAQGGGQEGDGSSAASVPTVAELLVLKAMQTDINERTLTLHGDFDAATASEAQLRQLAILGEDQTEVRRLTELVVQKAQGHGP